VGISRASELTRHSLTSQLAIWFATAIQVPEVKARLIEQGFYPVSICGDDFSAVVRKEYEDFGRAIRELNFKLE
jgi:tripartite-type tricarboxylate transporter receptor subunit TctC